MTLKIACFLILIISSFQSCSVFPHITKKGPTIHTQKVDAPFSLVTIKIPEFGKCLRFLITEFGALQRDKEKTSAAIVNAITKANGIGGGVVVITEGEWLTGKEHLILYLCSDEAFFITGCDYPIDGGFIKLNN